MPTHKFSVNLVIIKIILNIICILITHDILKTNNKNHI